MTVEAEQSLYRAHGQRYEVGHLSMPGVTR